MAIGAARVYVKPQGEPIFENYLKALKAGRSFVSTGPQVVFSVEGYEVGDVIKSNKKTAKWKLDVHSPVPYENVEIFVNGIVVDTQKSKNGNSETYSGSIEVPKGGWVTARVSGSKSKWPSMDSYAFAESSPIWFQKIGSTMPNTKIEAANKLLKILVVSEQRLKNGYGENKTPNLSAHFSKAREKLMNIVAGDKK